MKINRVVSFDEPSLENRMKEFEIRYELLINNFPIDHPLIVSSIIYLFINYCLLN